MDSSEFLPKVSTQHYCADQQHANRCTCETLFCNYIHLAIAPLHTLSTPCVSQCIAMNTQAISHIDRSERFSTKHAKNGYIFRNNTRASSRHVLRFDDNTASFVPCAALYGASRKAAGKVQRTKGQRDPFNK
jgi:hypothetical protein